VASVTKTENRGLGKTLAGFMTNCSTTD